MSKGASLTLDAGCALVLANCTITILVVAAGAPPRRPLRRYAPLLYAPSVFRPLSTSASPSTLPFPARPRARARAPPVLCTLADALKARQTEYYTNTRPRTTPSSVTTKPPPSSFFSYSYISLFFASSPSPPWLARFNSRDLPTGDTLLRERFISRGRWMRTDRRKGEGRLGDG